ncbi:hypothetical protein IB286_03470 [Spongiibacter sp. KMU-158]|uniref:Uncharacterized protein n=1 Tax=Spongiibacter pelagi TaxID=2760804 RepID=A0A927BZR5_9GAMM|nr:hypothetical protein [Spongiibacter pelagi]MBD2858054.1 hypothetical protein [Spongiibacter pelagi]
MGDVLPFAKRKPAANKQAGTLCREGHHKWKVDKAKQFDVKQGKLVTVYRCERCGKLKTTAH